jgi:mycothiol synthase
MLERFRRGELAFRPATLDDAAAVADVNTALFPDEPSDPVLERHWWETEDPAWTIERFAIERDGGIVGMALHRHAPWEKMPERYARVGGDLHPDWRAEGRLTLLFEAMEERARADGAVKLATYAREDDTFRQRLIAGRGYAEERRSKGWELDLAKHRERLLAMLERSRARMREQGIRILTYGEDDDPRKVEKIHAMNEEAEQDVPTTIPHVPYPLEVTVKWLRSPGLRPERMWLARLGDDIVGISMLSYPPVRGNVWTDWTATARSIRGRGVARALKLETVGQAIGLGVARVRTENDGQNAPILHLNEEMGYERIPGWIQYLKPA